VVNPALLEAFIWKRSVYNPCASAPKLHQLYSFVCGRQALDTDRNLHFGALALQADLLDPERFAGACAPWGTR
jgi:hypothetical protein